MCAQRPRNQGGGSQGGTLLVGFQGGGGALMGHQVKWVGREMVVVIQWTLAEVCICWVHVMGSCETITYDRSVLNFLLPQ